MQPEQLKGNISHIIYLEGNAYDNQRYCSFIGIRYWNRIPVLNNHPDVSEKARKKILSVIEENNFQPNSNARHLKMQSSSSVILIVKGTSNLLFADIVEQMQSLFLKNGENVSTYYIDEDANEVNYAIQLCRDRNPKGNRFLRR